MQPYFLPYIGYWQLINAVDKFIIYDNIEYSKGGWFNRNRILVNGRDAYITISLKKDSDYLSVNQRLLADEFNRQKLLNQIKGSYIKSPYYKDIFPLLEDIIMCQEKNLFDFLLYSIEKIVDLLHINTKLIVSSSLNINHSLKNTNKVLEICRELGADTYYNAIGGQKLYDNMEFMGKGIDLKFIKTDVIKYKQFNDCFVPNLSIVDVLMFNSVDEVNMMLDKYTLI